MITVGKCFKAGSVYLGISKWVEALKSFVWPGINWNVITAGAVETDRNISDFSGTGRDAQALRWFKCIKREHPAHGDVMLVVGLPHKKPPRKVHSKETRSNQALGDILFFVRRCRR